MPDYKALYFKLLRAHSEAIELLTQAGRQAEAMLLDSKDPLDLLQVAPNTGEEGAPQSGEKDPEE